MEQRNGRSPRILFLSFEPSILRMVSETLSPEGYDVTITHTAEETLAIIERDRGGFIVLTDNYQVNPEAVSLTKTVFARPDLHARVRVIGLAARVNANLIPLDVFVAMPFNVEELLSPIERACAELRGGALRGVVKSATGRR